MGMYIKTAKAGAPEAGIVGIGAVDRNSGSDQGGWLKNILEPVVHRAEVRREAQRIVKAEKAQYRESLRLIKMRALRAEFFKDAAKGPLTAFIAMYRGLPAFTMDKAATQGGTQGQLYAAAMQIGQMFAKSQYTTMVSNATRHASKRRGAFGVPLTQYTNEWFMVRSWILSAVALRAQIRQHQGKAPTQG